MGRAHEVRKAAMAKTAAKKSKVYSKFGRLIYLAAKNGEPDPEINLNLKKEIEKAKHQDVPADVINRAIEKAKGGVGEDYTTTRYEGFGPNGSMFIVECLTDNPTRTFAEVGVAFTKNDFKIGVDGSVVHIFNNQAVFSYEGLNDEDTLDVLIMADYDVDDIEYEDGLTTVFAPITEYGKIRDTLTEAMPDVKFLEDGIAWVPQTTTTLTDEVDKINFERFKEKLDEIDDVQDLYHNIVTEDEG